MRLFRPQTLPSSPSSQYLFFLLLLLTQSFSLPALSKSFVLKYDLCSLFADCTNARKIYVSLHGSSKPTCGSLHSPCSHVKDALQKSNDNDMIMIDGTYWEMPANFHEDKVTISKSVQIIGYNGKPTLFFKGEGTFITVQPNKTTFQKNISKVLFENVILMSRDDRTSILSVKDAFVSVSRSEFFSGNNSLNVDCQWSCQVTIEECTFVNMVTGIRISGGVNASINNTIFVGSLSHSQHAIILARKSLQSREPSDRIQVTESTFQHFSTAIAVNNTIGSEMNFNIAHCTFRNNFAFSTNEAAAISISFYNSSRHTTNVSIVSSSFVYNVGYYGGAVYINSSAPLLLNISHCSFEANRALIAGGAIHAFVRSSIYISESQFIKNTCEAYDARPFLETGYGGAIVLSGEKDSTYKTVVSNCHFMENTASAMGGTIYSSLRSSEVELLNVVLESCEQEQNRATDGDVVFLLSKVKMWNTTVRIKNPVNERNVFYVHNDDISIDRNSSFICTKGYRVGIMEIQGTTLPNGHFSLFSMLCRTCPYSHYSVVESSYRDLKVENPSCFPCPSNSVCNRGISRPKDNFWGYQVNSSAPITYIQLPMSYGCMGSECRHFNSCAANRGDVMCARCAKGYSEHVLANGCISNKYCNRTEFWLLTTAAVLLYIVLFLYKSEIFSLCKRNLNWLCSFRRRERPGNVDVVNEDVYVRVEDGAVLEGDSGNCQAPCTQRSTGDREFGSGLLKIVFYFYQIEIILHEDVGNKDDTILKQALQVPLSFFNFNFLATYNSKLCAFTDTTPVKKVFFRIALITMVFLGLSIIIMIVRLLEKLNRESVTSCLRTLGDKALSASFEIFVLVYGVYVMAGLKLLNCVPYKDEKRLLIQGNIKCFSIWQYVIMFVMILWALPYCIFIFLLPKWLQRQEASRLGILFGCLFPLPFLMQKLYQWRLSSPFDRIVDTPDDPVVHRILESLIASFRKSKKKREFLWWEGVYIFRRLLVISLVRFVHGPFARNQLMLFAQVMFLLHHMYCRPFNRRFLNHLETASLTILVMFTSTSARYAYNYKYGITGDDTSTFSDVFAWLRVIVIIALPCIAVALFIVPLILWFIRNIMKLIVILVSHIKCYSRTV